MPNGVYATRKWIYGQLTGDATVTGVVGANIFAEEAPQEATFPMIVFAHIGNVDTFRATSEGYVNKAIWLVRVVVAGSSVEGDALTVAERFNSLLLQSNIVIGDVRINLVQHDQDHVRSDSQQGVPLSYLGAYYLVFTQPA